jgi:DNA-binding transcriptional LysR family regulator
MLNYARDVLRLGDKLKISLDEHRSGIRGYVRVSPSSSVLSDFVRENPQIKLDLEERPSESTIIAVLNKQSDLGIIVRDRPVEGLKMIDSSADRLAVALPTGHRFSKRSELRSADILDEELVALESGTATHRLLSSRASELGRPMRVRVQVRSF